MSYAAIDQDALLAMNRYLKPLEFQVFSVYKMEEFLGGGVCRLNKKEICEKYNFTSYDYFTHASKSLEDKKWIFVSEEGVRCRQDFSQEAMKKIEEELRNSKSESGETEKFSVKKAKKLRISKSVAAQTVKTTEKFSASGETQLRNSKLPTENFSVTDLEILSSTDPALKDLDFKDFKEEEVFANAHTSESEPTIHPETEIPPETNPEPEKQKISDPAYRQLAVICFCVKHDRLSDLTGKQRGQISYALGQMRKKGFDVSKIPKFHEWWKTNWRSGYGRSDSYVPPRPDQFLENWNEAMEAKKIAKEIKEANESRNENKTGTENFAGANDSHLQPRRIGE